MNNGYQDPLFNYPDKTLGEKLRDEGISTVSANAGSWMDMAMLVVKHLPHEWTGMGEDIRVIVCDRIGPPHHQNAWGALTRMARDKQHIERTGEMRKPRDPSSHARMTQVYRKVARFQ
jgi:hypothetical protein